MTRWFLILIISIAALALPQVSEASPPLAPKDPLAAKKSDADLDARQKLLKIVTQKMKMHKDESQRLLMWTTDYIVLVAQLPREEAYEALNKLSDFYESFKQEEKVAFAFFILNQKEIKSLLDKKDIRDLLFLWTIKILELHPLNEEHSQNLLIYWANTTGQYADGPEYKDRIDTLLISLGKGLPSVPAMADWFTALQILTTEKREGYRDALLSFIPVIRNNRIMNTILIPNMDLNFSMHYPHWSEEIHPKNQTQGFKISNLEFAYLFPFLWKELNKLVKENLFKIPANGKTEIPAHLSETADRPLWFTLDLQRNFRNLIFKEFIDYNFEKERPLDAAELTQALADLDAMGYFDELELSFFSLKASCLFNSEQKTKIQEITQFMITSFPESKKDFIFSWMMVMGSTIDFNSLNLESSIISLNAESPAWIVWEFKGVFPELWTNSRQKFFTTLLTTHDHENIAMRRMKVSALMDRLTQLAGVPEEHLIAFLMYIHLKQAFKQDTQDFGIPLFVRHNETDDMSDEQTFMFAHYTELEHLHAMISPQLLAIGLNELDASLLPTVAQELVGFIKKKLEKETLDQTFATEKELLVQDIMEFQTQLLNKSKAEDEFRSSYLPLTPTAVSAIGKAIGPDAGQDNTSQSAYQTQNTSSIEIYEMDSELSDEKFEKGSEHLFKSLKALQKEDYKNANIKDYFIHWIPLHYIKASKDLRKPFIDQLLAILDEFDHPEYLNRLRLIIASYMKIPRSDDTEDGFIKLTQMTIQHADQLSQDPTFPLGDVLYNESKHLFSYLTDDCLTDIRKIEFNEIRSSLFSLISATEIGTGDFGKPTLDEDEKIAFSGMIDRWLTDLIYNTEHVGENGNTVLNFTSTSRDPNIQNPTPFCLGPEGLKDPNGSPRSLDRELEFLENFKKLTPQRTDEIEKIIAKTKAAYFARVQTSLAIGESESSELSESSCNEEQQEHEKNQYLNQDRYHTLSYFRQLTRFIRELTPEQLEEYLQKIENSAPSTWNTQTQIFDWFIRTLKNSPYLKYSYRATRELLKLTQTPRETSTINLMERLFPEEPKASDIGGGPQMFERK